MRPQQICFFGDSITVGYSDAEGLGWPGRLCRGLGSGVASTSCYNLAVNGDTSRDIGARWRAETAARSRDGGPGALVFAFGLNDASVRVGEGAQVELEESLAIARDMLSEAMRLAPVLWLGPTPIDENVNPMVEADVVWDMRNADIQRYSEAYAELAQRIGVAYLDVTATLIDDHSYTRALAESDGVHPASDGYARIAELVAEWDAWRTMVA